MYTSLGKTIVDDEGRDLSAAHFTVHVRRALAAL
jgi:hypothetical protein